MPPYPTRTTVSLRSLLPLLALLTAFRGLAVRRAVSACGDGTGFAFGEDASAWAAFFMIGGSIPGQCRPCAAGTFRQADGADLFCRGCSEGTVSDAGSTSCRRPGHQACPAGMFDSGLREGCVACLPGTFKGSGDGACSLCPTDTFSGPGSAKCKQCGLGEVAAPGSKACVVCRAGTFANDGVCWACPEGSSSEEGSVSCTCMKGWTRGKSNEGLCARCPKNTFKAVGGGVPCTPCPFDMVTSHEGSGDVLHCVPFSVLSAVSSGFAVMLKGSGIIAEEPSERRWRQEATVVLSDRFSDMAEATAAAVQGAREGLLWLLEQLQGCIADLFHDAQGFARERCEEWKRATSPEICTSEREQKRWLSSQDAYDVWRRAASRVRVGRSVEGCRKVKSAARKVLLLVHPDKFLALHPSCSGRGSSELLARDFNREYQVLKDLCSGY